MNNHYATYLEKKYEPLYSGQYGGFAVSDGWFDLINALSKELCHKWLNAKQEYEHTKARGETYWGQKITDEDLAKMKAKMDAEYDAVPRASQVKEKFGTLRFYIGSPGASKEQHAAIWFAESMSASICEKCGSRGRIRHGGWMRTLCNKHEAEHQAELKKRDAVLDDLSQLSQELGGY